jgi:hypothetical protein
MFEPIRTELPNKIKNNEGEYVNPVIEFKDYHKK